MTNALTQIRHAARQRFHKQDRTTTRQTQTVRTERREQKPRLGPSRHVVGHSRDETLHPLVPPHLTSALAQVATCMPSGTAPTTCKMHSRHTHRAHLANPRCIFVKPLRNIRPYPRRIVFTQSGYCWHTSVDTTLRARSAFLVSSSISCSRDASGESPTQRDHWHRKQTTGIASHHTHRCQSSAAHVEARSSEGCAASCASTYATHHPNHGRQQHQQHQRTNKPPPEECNSIMRGQQNGEKKKGRGDIPFAFAAENHRDIPLSGYSLALSRR